MKHALMIIAHKNLEQLCHLVSVLQHDSLPIGCHSEVFDTLGRFGLWGFLSLVGFYVCCIKDIAASLMYRETSKCLILVIVVYLITCVLDPGLYTQQVFPILILLPLMELGYSDKSHIVGGSIP